MSVDPQTVRQHPPSAEEEVQVQTQDRDLDQPQEPIRTLLWTAATIRPLDEVAALVALLRGTGEVPSPADEALRAAAVARPLDEVRQLVQMLNEPPGQLAEADAALRAAAVGRPIEDVAQLVSILGTDGAAPAEAERAAEAVRATAPEPALEALAEPAADLAPSAEAVETRRQDDAAKVLEKARGTAPERTVEAHQETAERARGNAREPSRRAGTFRFVPPAVRENRAPDPPARTQGADRPQARVKSAASQEDIPGAGPAQALRSGLRRPTGAVLVVMGLIHLPKDVTELRSGGSADMLSVVITVLCLVLAVWLVVQDMVWIWGASAVAAATVLVVHSMVGFGSIALPDSSLGGSYVWARTVALACAVAGLALCGSALLRRRTGRVPGDVPSVK